MATAKPIDEMKECPVCTEVYIDPRVLPCGHTLCFKCIAQYCKDKPAGDEVACPMCRTEFTIPSSGVGGLPKNFALANILHIKELTIESPMKSVPASQCDQHKDEPMKIYCFDCKVVMCTMCFIESHNGHRCSGVSKAAGEFSKQMRTDIGNITGGADKCRRMLNGLGEKRKRFSEQIEKTERQINENTAELKRMIDIHREKLISELSSLQQKRMEEIELVREEIETQLASMESYKESVNELIEKGAACDIVRAANDLHDRANKLLTFDAIERSLAELGHVGVTFTTSNHVTDDVSRTLGGERCQIKVGLD